MYSILAIKTQLGTVCTSITGHSTENTNSICQKMSQLHNTNKGFLKTEAQFCLGLPSLFANQAL